MDTGSLVKNYFIHEASFDLAELETLFAQRNFRFDNVKKAHDGPGTHYYPKNFGRYQAKLMSLLGIASESALDLLSRAKAAKNIGSLDGFVRRFMLEPPSTFTIAEELCSGFAEIEQLYETVVDQKRRADALADTPASYERYEQLAESHIESDRLLDGLILRYRDQLKQRLIDTELERLEAIQHDVAEQLVASTATVKEWEAHVESANDQLANLDGGALARLETRHRDAQTTRDTTKQRRDTYADLCAQAGLTPADALAILGR